MLITDPDATDAADLLATIARLLSHASDLTLHRPGRRLDLPTQHLGLGLDLAAAQALELRPGGYQMTNEPEPLEREPLQLLRAAEQTARLRPIEDFPPGTSQLIVTICDLLREHAT